MSARVHRSFSLIALVLLSAAPVLGRSAEAIQFNLPAQSLADALRAVGTLANTSVVFDPALVDGKSAPALEGEATLDEALEKLLAGTGITHQFLNEKTVILAGHKDKGRDARSGHIDAQGEKWVRVAQAEGAQTPASASTESAGASTAAAEDSLEKLEEITVTAQKRVERLKDVPISISVLSGADLDKSTAEGISEALGRVPGVAASAVFMGGATQIGIRGIAAGNSVLAGSSPVAYYLDSVPFGLVKTAVAPDSNAYDMKRVEVLRGPQGTLYGANALSGVVRVLTEDAHLDAFEFKGRTSASGTRDGGENYRGDLAVNVPLVTGKVAARAVVGYQDLAGWIDKPNAEDANDGEIRNMRLKINAKPTDRLSVGLSAWASRADYGAPPLSADGRQSPSVLDESLSTDYNVYGLKVDYDFAAFSFSSMTSYLDYTNRSNLDLDAIGVDVDDVGPIVLFTGFQSHVFSQEFILNSTGGKPWRWSAGAFYRNGDDRIPQYLFDTATGGAATGVRLNGGVDFGNGSESHAVFGEVGRRFHDNRLEWTLGLRYFHDIVMDRQNQPDVGQPPDTVLHHVVSSFNSTTPRAVLTWHPNEDVTSYISYSEGFRSGAPQNVVTLAAVPGIAPLEPDTLHNYEIGTKAELLDRRLTLDAALYYLDWTDIQQQLQVAAPGNPVPVIALINAGDASGIGVDFGLSARPIHGLELGLTFSWNNLEMDSDVISATSDTPGDGVIAFAKGDRPNFSPEYTVGASAEYAFPLGGSGLQGRFSAEGNYVSEQVQRQIIVGLPFIGVGDTILTTRASFSIGNPARWEATLFADNLSGDEEDAVVRQPGGPAEWDVHTRPRTVGVQFEYRFD